MREKILQGYNTNEMKVLQRLNTPKKIQDFLNTLKINFERGGETCRSPRRVLRDGTAHCMEGAMLAAAALEFHGQQPLVLDLRSVKPHDDDHVVAVFRQHGCWGALSKTNHAVLRYREPVYRTVRELVLSYFHEYFLHNGKKTLREFSRPFNLKFFNKLKWRTAEKDLFAIPRHLDRIKHYPILLPAQIRTLRLADDVEITAGKIVVEER